MNRLLRTLMCLACCIFLASFVVCGVADERPESARIQEHRIQEHREIELNMERMRELMDQLNEKLKRLGDSEDGEELRRLILRERDEVADRIDVLHHELKKREIESRLPRLFREQREQVRQNGLKALHQDLRELEVEIEQRRKAGKFEEVEKLERQAEAIHEELEHHAHREGHGDDHHGHEHDGHHHDDNPERRLHHMHVAIENLKAAGLDEHAEDVARLAQQFERELRQRHEEHDHRHHHDRVDELEAAVNDLRKEMKSVARTLKELVDWAKKQD